MINLYDYYNADSHRLSLPNYYNDELLHLPNGIEKIEFMYDSIFNKSLDKLPNSITHITFGNCFNSFITK